MPTKNRRYGRTLYSALPKDEEKKAKLLAMVKDVRRNPERLSQSALAYKHGVSAGFISQIATGKVWWWL